MREQKTGIVCPEPLPNWKKERKISEIKKKQNAFPQNEGPQYQSGAFYNK